jgi:ribonuclease PH
VAAVDMNIVTLDSGFVEIQGTGEHGTFSEDQLVQLLASAREGLEIIRKEQLDSLKSDI